MSTSTPQTAVTAASSKPANGTPPAETPVPRRRGADLTRFEAMSKIVGILAKLDEADRSAVVKALNEANALK